MTAQPPPHPPLPLTPPLYYISLCFGGSLFAVHSLLVVSVSDKFFLIAMTMDKRFVVYIVARYWLLVPIFRGFVRLSALCVFGVRYYFPSPPPPPSPFLFLHYTYVRAMAILQNRRCTLVSFPAGLDLSIGSYNCDIRLLFFVLSGQGKGSPI